MKTKNHTVLWDGVEVARLRKVRADIARRYKSLDGLCAHLEKLEQTPRTKPAKKARAKRV